MNRKGLSPNPLQIFRFLDAADVVLASPPFGLGRVSNVVLGECPFYNIFVVAVCFFARKEGGERDGEGGEDSKRARSLTVGVYMWGLLIWAITGRWIGGYLFGLPTRYEILEPKKSS